MEFDFIVESCCKVTCRVGMDKVNNESLHVMAPIVASAIKVLAHISFWHCLVYISPVALKPLH